MIKEFPVTKKQAALLAAAQSAVNGAQSTLDAIVATVLAGLDVEGRVVSVNDEKLELSVEVPEPEA